MSSVFHSVTLHQRGEEIAVNHSRCSIFPSGSRLVLSAHQVFASVTTMHALLSNLLLFLVGEEENSHESKEMLLQGHSVVEGIPAQHVWPTCRHPAPVLPWGSSVLFPGVGGVAGRIQTDNAICICRLNSSAAGRGVSRGLRSEIHKTFYKAGSSLAESIDWSCHWNTCFRSLNQLGEQPNRQLPCAASLQGLCWRVRYVALRMLSYQHLS